MNDKFKTTIKPVGTGVPDGPRAILESPLPLHYGLCRFSYKATPPRLSLGGVYVLLLLNYSIMM
jgi:hypothetical protein